MALRLNLQDPKDREFLEKRVGKDKIRELLSSSSNQSILTNKALDSEMTSVDRVNTSDMKTKPKRSKYQNIKEFDQESGITFDSRWEASCFRTLKNLQDKGRISNLRCQERINLIVENTKICAIIIDFVFEYQGFTIYSDAKSVATSPPGFRVKMKLFEALYKTKLYLIVKNKDKLLEYINENKSI